LLGFFDKEIIKARQLYSAKKNKYRLSVYQQNCSGVENMLIVIKGKDGKLFGGFLDKKTPSIKMPNGLFQRVRSEKAFTFSITNNHKFFISSE
jgi:hypothetical protein